MNEAQGLDSKGKSNIKHVLLGSVGPMLLLVVGLSVLLWWLRSDSELPLKERVPGADKPAELITTEPAAARTQGVFTKGDGTPGNLPGAWPGFRGPNGDGISPEKLELLTRWDSGGPKVLWMVEVGEGHAGASVWGGRVYLLDYDRERQADALRCLSLADGREIWRYSYPVKIKRNHGMSRTICAVNEKYVVSLGPKCQVTCLNSTTGALGWMLDLVKDFGTVVPPWYAGQCPLMDGNSVILAPGGESLMMAVDCGTGKIIWKTPNDNGWTMTHSSIVPMSFAGKKMYLYCGSGGVSGVDAKDGAVLWTTTDWRIRIATVPSPVVLPEGRIFLSGGYNAGSMMLQLADENGVMKAKILFRLAPEVFGSAQHTPIFYQNYLYGVRPDGQLVCLDVNGNVMWTSGSAHRFGLGPYLIANGLIYVMDDAGLLTLAEATPESFKPLAQAKVLPGQDSWGPMALVGGRLIVRDLTLLECLEVGKTP
jgi:outer membrane protein assembly factor BamB